MNRRLLDNTKSGMQNLKLERINQVINDYTYGSAKYDMQVRKTQRAAQKSQRLVERYGRLTSIELEVTRIQISNTLSSLKNQFAPRIIVVLDFDCFFAAVEIRDNPKLKTQPVAVVGGSIVCTSNYVARQFGVRAALPVRVAKALCPNLVCIDSDMHKYMQVSRACGPIFAKYDPSFVMLGCDECSLDITELVAKEMNTARQNGAARLTEEQLKALNTNFYSPPGPLELCTANIVNRLRNDVKQFTYLTVSCGVGCSRQIAKIGADLRKPDGYTVSLLKFQSNDEMFGYFRSFLSTLPIRKIWGIGQAVYELLSYPPFEITHVGQIVEKQELLLALLTPSIINLVISAHGLMDISAFGETSDLKSIGHAHTFYETAKVDDIKHVLLQLSKAVCERLETHNLSARRVQLTIRFADWTDQQHVEDLNCITRDLDVIYNKASAMFDKLFKVALYKKNVLVTVGLGDRKRDVPAYFVRLVGVRVLQFDEEVDGGISQYLKSGRYEAVKDTHLEMQDDDFEVVGVVKNSARAQEKGRPKGAIDYFLRKK